MSHPLLTRLRTELQAVADPARAPGMQAYMKSAMPYHGVPTPIARPLFKRVFKDVKFKDAAEWQAAVRALWHGAAFREERYAALHLLQHRVAKDFRTPGVLPLYEELVVSGAWWDYVDDIATHAIGELLRAYPDELEPQMLAWSQSEDMWKRRSAIICQVGAKGKTDLPLLYATIEPALDSREFFLRKAIGWALREVAWHQPQVVIDYVNANQARLSPLSRREALKNLLKQGLVSAVPT